MFLNSIWVDIICIYEHWITINHIINNVYFGSYKVPSIYARIIHIHGRALILVKKGLKFTEIEFVKNLSAECDFEICL